MASYKLTLSPRATEELIFWSKNDLKTLRKIFSLIEDIQKMPFRGLGQPEALKHHFSGQYSRRIDERNRLVYEVEDDQIVILQCRFHYDE